MKRKPDILKLFHDRVTASHMGSTWAYSAYEAYRAGRLKEAEASYKKAKKWLDKVQQIDAKYDAIKARSKP